MKSIKKWVRELRVPLNAPAMQHLNMGMGIFSIEFCSKIVL